MGASTVDILKQMAASKTVWGVLILIFNMFLKDSPLDEALGEQIAHAITQFLDAIGAVVALWGRLTAKGPIVNQPAR